MKLSNQHKAALASYVRSVVGAVAAVVATGNYAPEDLAKAAVAALLPPLLRWANPKDSSFGRGSEAA
jgi:hypothetical protein